MGFQLNIAPILDQDFTILCLLAIGMPKIGSTFHNAVHNIAIDLCPALVHIPETRSNLNIGIFYSYKKTNHRLLILFEMVKLVVKFVVLHNLIHL